ncbi:hypothetical protein DFP72DRAFT_326891 [Ephemerocybe angulata]|uniref:SET domain-containing protein n=1 Tax=Ephemerocybe angulata TaxID=980116 RepID=A0A8H6IG24_9AGAR|nr:hypothetical protein DFP72DRAFT_326891 [Tulosesus angulatus]
MQSSIRSPEPEDLHGPHPFAPDTPPQDILATLWNKFYAWEYGHTLSLLQGLKCDSNLRADDHIHRMGNEAPTHQTTQPSEVDIQETEAFEVVDYDEYGGKEISTLLAVVSNEAADLNGKVWLPNPRYTTCTSTSSNIYNHSQNTDILIASFACFADEPSFDLDRYLRYHDRFAWQCDFHDPDYEVIKLEVIGVLHFQQGLSFDEIDELIGNRSLVLPAFNKLHVSAADGLVWEACQRDYLYQWPVTWMSPLDTLRKVKQHYSTVKTDLFSQVQLASTLFCPNFGCLVSSLKPCPVHNAPAIREVKPTITSKKYDTRSRPCSGSCFQHIQENLDDDALEYLCWPDGSKDLEELESMMKLAPDGLPCDLSIILRKPCDQIFANRKRSFRDEEIPSDDEDVDPRTRKKAFEYLDSPQEKMNTKTGVIDITMYPPIPPCSHNGPCSLSTCSCYKERYHCVRECRCDKDCTNRRKGCNCKPQKKNWGKPSKEALCKDISLCSCRLEMMECDPELCKGCACRNTDTKGRARCTNNNVQHGRFNRLRIQRSEWGYGAYAAEPIPKGAIVGVYVGEHMLAPHPETEEMLQKHTGLNYAFGLYGNTVIDSKSAGNETRYLNHANDPDANCIGSSIVLHNTQAIILESTKKIKMGEQLLLNYGEKYWNPDGKDDESSDGEEGLSNSNSEASED